jgi:hypothetical protein
MVVHIVPYTDPPVRLSTWCHALGDNLARPLRERAECGPRDSSAGAMPCSTPARCSRAARRWPTSRSPTAPPTRSTAAATCASATPCSTPWWTPTARSKRFFRVTSESFEDARERHPEIEALVVFPHFEPSEVIEIAAGRQRLPPGITRHVIRWRALRVDVPLERLADAKTSLAARTAGSRNGCSTSCAIAACVLRGTDRAVRRVSAR